MNCTLFNGGYCKKINKHVPKSWCVNACPLYQKDDVSPSLIKQIISFTKAAYTQVKQKNPIRSDIEIEKLREICKMCEYFSDNKGRPRCKKCGCYMNVKQRWATSNCIIGKW